MELTISNDIPRYLVVAMHNRSNGLTRHYLRYRRFSFHCVEITLCILVDVGGPEHIYHEGLDSCCVSFRAEEVDNVSLLRNWKSRLSRDAYDNPILNSL